MITIYHKDVFSAMSSEIGEEESLFALVEEAAEYAYTPYSNFKDGAAGILSDGTVVLGANLEFRGDLTNTIHAEQAVIIQAMLLGQDITCIAVNHPPCGFCRQSLAELNGSDKIKVLFKTDDRVISTTLNKLFPHKFSPRNLGQVVLPSNNAPLNVDFKYILSKVPVTLALEVSNALAKSYSPRSNSPAAVAIQDIRGNVYGGFYMESCAFNPSISALRFALVNMALHSDVWRPSDLNSCVAQVLLVFSSNRNIDHLNQTRIVLKNMGYSNAFSSLEYSMPLEHNHVTQNNRKKLKA